MMQTEWFLPENMKRAIGPVRIGVEAILIALLAVMLARMAWLIIAPEASVAKLEQRSLPTLQRDVNQTISADRSLLLQLNPFETEFAALIPDAPETQLNLRLAGVIMSTDDFGGSAQITTPDNQTRRYVSGTEILPGVVVERVLSDRVILRRNGESETLMLGGRGEGLMVIGDGSQTTPPSGEPSASTPSAIIEGQVADTATLLRDVQLSPVERDGRLVGYALSSRGAVETMSAAGLAPGDVLLEINGTSVRELAVNELISEIGESQTAMLQVERGETVQTIRLGFDE